MLEIARQAARHWGLGEAPVTLVARRENVVFRVGTPTGDYALRLHRPGYRDEAQLTSELQWMAALANGGLSVPAPLQTTQGGLIAVAGGHMVDVLQWLPGAPLGKAGELQGITDRPAFCRMLGGAMARLHGISDEWPRPMGFTRPRWDRAGLVGSAPIWGRFWEHPHLSGEDRDLLREARARADAALAGIEDQADFGLIHADLLSENMLFDAGRLSLIDFDDGGFGFRDFELATFLLRFVDAPDYAALREALLTGYRQRRRVNPAHLELFVLLRALSYPGWIMDRLDEPGAGERSARAITTAVTRARHWLETEGRR